MTNTAYCPMIHGGLQIHVKGTKKEISHCCSRSVTMPFTGNDMWNAPEMLPLRQLNLENKWDDNCYTCKFSESNNQPSFRTSTLEKYGNVTGISGPKRIDLSFDPNCNLACRTCDPYFSTLWQKQYRENNISFPIFSEIDNSQSIIKSLDTLDLAHLEDVVLAGGETLLGTSHWDVAEYLVNRVPNAHERLTISFQTNGTMPIPSRYYHVFDKCHMIRLNFSLDGIGEKFEYLRWPASWEQVVDNINEIKETIPANHMFLVEETISIFNLYYLHELDSWVKNNFAKNRLGDHVNHTRHNAIGIFGINNLTDEYANALAINSLLPNPIHENFIEQPERVNKMIDEISRFDKIRNQDWTKTFPEVASFYSRYL